MRKMKLTEYLDNKKASLCVLIQELDEGDTDEDMTFLEYSAMIELIDDMNTMMNMGKGFA